MISCPALSVLYFNAYIFMCGFHYSFPPVLLIALSTGFQQLNLCSDSAESPGRGGQSGKWGGFPAGA